MRDLYVGINAVPLLSPWTGVGQYTYYLTHELQKVLSTHPALFYGTSWKQKLRTSPIAQAHSIKKVIKRVIPYSYYLSRFMQQLRFSSGVSKHKIDLYHEPNFVCYQFAGPTVITIHDLSYIHYRETHPIERIKHMDRYMPSSINQAQHIIVDSEFVKREVMNYYGISEKKITTTLLGVSAAFKPSMQALSLPVLQKYGLTHKQYILAVGTLEPRKNIKVIINAFLRLPLSLRQQFPLVLVGMRGLQATTLTEQFAKVLQSREVILLGYVAQDDLPKIYSSARLFVYPSIYEGFGLPPLEAMACGTPVLTSNCASLPEVIGDAGVLISPQDEEGWSTWMQVFIENEKLSHRYSQLGSQRAQLFSWERCARQTLSAYECALGS